MKSPFLVLTTSTSAVEMLHVFLFFAYFIFPFFLISILIVHKLESPNEMWGGSI